MKKRCSVAPGGLPIVLPRVSTSREGPQKTHGITGFLGLVQIILGLGCVTLEAVLLVRGSTLGDTVLTAGVGIGVVFALCGTIGVATRKNQKDSMIWMFMVLCFLSAIFALLLLFAGCVGIYMDKSDYLPRNYERHTINNDCVPRHLHRQPAPPGSVPAMTMGRSAGDNTGNFSRGNSNNTKNNQTSSALLVGAVDSALPNNATETGYWYDPDPPCPVGVVKKDGYRTPKGRLRLVLAMHGLVIIFSVLELTVATVASAVCCNAVCCGKRLQGQYSYAYPAPTSPTSPDVSTTMPPGGKELQPTLMSVQGMYPMDIPLDTTDAAHGYQTYPPFYSSLRDDFSCTKVVETI